MHVAALHVFPVKGLRGVAPPWAAVEPWGLAGDRRWMVVDSSHRFLTQRQLPLMATVDAEIDHDGIALTAPGRAPLRVLRPKHDAPTISATVWKDQVPAQDAGDTAAALLGAVLGVACRLVFMPDPDAARPVDPTFAQAGDHVSFADGFPLLLTSQASLQDLNGRLGQPVPMSRFRPNLVVAGGDAWAEDGWRRLRVGTAVFDSVKPCARCVVTTVDQDTGRKSEDAEPIRTLQRFRRDERGQVLFGQNLIPRGTGRIGVGDPVVVLD